MYCTAEDVIIITNVKPKHFNLEKDDGRGLNLILNDWIEQAQGLIDSYCHTTFPRKIDEGNIPLAVKNVCIRIVSNMVAFQQVRRDNPIKQVNDWTYEIRSSDIFTDDEKDDLKPFILDKSTVSDKIDIFTITGD